MLNRDEIIKRTNNGLDVFKYYIPCQWRVGHNFLNPLYEDHKAHAMSISTAGQVVTGLKISVMIHTVETVFLLWAT
jgi:hypothetical protein